VVQRTGLAIAIQSAMLTRGFPVFLGTTRECFALSKVSLLTLSSMQRTLLLLQQINDSFYKSLTMRVLLFHSNI